jgi:hypothetical protein
MRSILRQGYSRSFGLLVKRSFFNIRYCINSTFQDSSLGFSLMKACSRVDPQTQPSPRPGYSPHCNKRKDFINLTNC